VIRSSFASAGSEGLKRGERQLPGATTASQAEASPTGQVSSTLSISPDQPRRLRIVHVFRAPIGGLFRHVQDLAAAQAEAGHAVGLVCDVGGGPRADAALAALAPRMALGITRWPIFRAPNAGDLTLLARTMALLRRTKPDVVHGHGAKGGLAARFAASIGIGGRYVTAYTPHGGSLNYTGAQRGDFFYVTAEQFLVRGTDALTFESQYAADRFVEVMKTGDSLVRVIRNGAHPHEFEPVVPDEDATDLLYLGEFREVKGLDTLIDALALLGSRGRDVTLTMIGAGPDEALLRRRIADYALTTIRIETPRPAREAMRRGKALVLPSRAESLPYVLIEAAAAGLPIIATNVGGVAEIMAPFAFGLVPPNDTDALADAIARRIAEPETLRQFSARIIQKHVQDSLSVDRMVREIEQTYREALQRRGLT
jgi:glycosyltransferase involved in cell wall biosynthesis